MKFKFHFCEVKIIVMVYMQNLTYLICFVNEFDAYVILNGNMSVGIFMYIRSNMFVVENI